MRNKLLKTLLLGTFLAFIWQSSIAQTIIISEVADPGDDYTGRFVELYNATNSSIDLGAGSFHLTRQANGSGYADITLTGTIASGETYIIGSTDFETVYGFAPDVSSGSISGNGDDGYFLYSGGDHTSGTLIDAYGELDVDGTGEAWEYEDSRAVRNQDIGTANTTWTSTEWTIAAADVADMTPGAHTCDYPSGSDTEAPTWVDPSPYVEKVIENRFDLVANLNETGTVYYMLMNDGEAAPSIADIMNANSLTISQADTEFSVTSDDTLSTATAYDLYVVAKDDAGNVQADDTLIEFTTSDARTLTLTRPVGGDTLYAGDTDSITWTQSNVDYVDIKIYDPDAAEWFYPGEEYMKADATTEKMYIPIPNDAMTSSGYRAAIMDWADVSLADTGGTFTVMDTIRPVITEMHPADDATGVSFLDTTMEVGFSEAVTIGTGNITIKKTSDNSVVETIDVTSGNVYGNTDTSAVIKLQNVLEANTEYYINAEEGVAEDMSGNPLAAIDDAETWNFTTGSSVTISEIQDTTGTGDEASPLAGQNVITGGIVADVVSGAYYIHDAAGAWNGIKVIDGDNTPAIGDEIMFNADVAENYGFTRLENITNFTTSSTGNEVYAADTVTTGEAAHEKYEGVYIYIKEATCINADAGYGMWTIDDGSGALMVDDNYYAYTPTLDMKYNIKGFMHYSYGDKKILPTEAADIEQIYAGPTFSDGYIDPEAPTSSDDIYVYMSVEDLMYPLDTVFVAYGTESGVYDDTLGMLPTKAPQPYQNNTPIPAQPDGTTVYYKVTAINDNGDESESTEMSYTVMDPATAELPFLEEFVADLGQMYTFDVTGEGQQWEFGSYSGSTYAEMSGYDGGNNVNEDWLITPGFDFTGVTNATLQFKEAINYGGPVEDQQEVYISTDYSGTGDPNNATWTELTVTGGAAGDSWDFFTVDPIDLSAYAGETNVHIGFKYTSTEDTAATWEVDSIVIAEPATGEAPVIENVTTNPGAPTPDDAVSISADITDADGTIATATLHWGTASDALDSTINMSVSTGDTYVTDEDIPAYPENTFIYYRVRVEDNDGNIVVTAKHNYKVKPSVVNLPFVELFEGTDLGQMSQYNVTGAQEWYRDTYGGKDYAKMNGYTDSANENEDWLITPAMDFTGLSVVTLKFEEAINYADVIEDDQEVYVSTDYSGSGDPNNATWTELTVNERAGGSSWDFTHVYPVDLSDYIGEPKVFVAFKYTSTTSNAATWEVDSIKITETALPNRAPEITNASFDPTSPTDEDDVQVSADITDPDGDAISATLYWGTASDAMTNEVSFTATGVGDQYTGTIPAQDAETHVYFKIEAEDGEDTTTVTGDYTVESSTPPDGIEDLTELDMEVYPNPSNGQFNIVVNENTTDNFRVAVYNISGQMVYQSEFNAGQESRKTINITNLSDGVYYLQVRSDKAIKVIKLLKQ